ncbi:hypothetical protein AB0H43_19370 [Hamadaea sp. NPDC050747]|uniref:hypothetical protein n=1 Tax=Hamadaea sp. NPDC050747 TaxID=3155789 RepID=UPI0033C6FF17
MLSEVCDAISPARLATYLRATGGDVTEALSLYRWNQDIAGGFLRPLCNLEVTLRNALVEQLEILARPHQWWEHCVLGQDPKSRIKLNEAMARLRYNRRALTKDTLVAEMMLGFWVGLLDSQFDAELWRRGLHRAFPHYHGPRGTLRAELKFVLHLRNRIGHHEPIYHRHLAADHLTIHRLLGYLSPEMRGWSLTQDPLPVLIGGNPVPRQRIAAP